MNSYLALFHARGRQVSTDLPHRSFVRTKMGGIDKHRFFRGSSNNLSVNSYGMNHKLITAVALYAQDDTVRYIYAKAEII